MIDLYIVGGVHEEIVGFEYNIKIIIQFDLCLWFDDIYLMVVGIVEEVVEFVVNRVFII